MKRSFRSLLTIGAVLVLAGCSSSSDAPAGEKGSSVTKADAKSPGFSPSKERSFHFVYETTVKDIPAGKSVRVWIPVPQTTDHQTISNLKHEPADAKITQEMAYGNKMLFVEIPAASAATATVKLEFDVARKLQEVRLEGKSAAAAARPDNPLFLASHKLAPVDGKATELAKGAVADGDSEAVKARKLYDYVVKNTSYSKKGSGWGRGSIDWVCTEKYGNCTDFHALMISMARSQKMPAMFEMGVHLPFDKAEGDVGGYHCWALVWVEGFGWVPIDASEAQKRVGDQVAVDYYCGTFDADRVTFTTGRDLDLEPKQSGDPLNYFIYPFVEVDGKPYDSAKIERKFKFKNL